MIFDAKMEDFAAPAQPGHVTKAPATLTYASVAVSRDWRIALLIAALNDIDIWAADVLNATSPRHAARKSGPLLEKSLGRLRPQSHIRALYGLKSSGAAFRAHLAGCMREMGYVSCPADPDLWLKEQTDRKGRKYYSYILCY
eukprot:CCRYP_019200-RB/>CCRYP_019200-RB protein AED:0.43 eAED:0.49 QI:0/0/0/1/0/0/2/0/141